jgi:hypothetical protein
VLVFVLGTYLNNAELHSESAKILDTPMEIAPEMARLVLEMKKGRNARLKLRLEMLAEDFLRITGQDREPDSIDSIDIRTRRPDGANLTM